MRPLRHGHEPKLRPRHHDQRPLGADDDATVIVARILPRRPAQPHHRPVAQDPFKPQDVVRGHAVGEAVRAARVLRHVSADGARLLARGVRRVPQAVGGRRLRDVQVDHAGVDQGRLARSVDLMDAAHPGQRQQQAPVGGNRAAAQTRACAPGHHRQLVFVGYGDHPRRLLRRGWKDHHLRQRPVHGGVVLVGQQLVRAVKDVRTADDPSQVTNQGL